MTNKVSQKTIDALMKRVSVHFVHGEQPTPYIRADAWLDGKFFLATAISKAVDPENFNRTMGLQYSEADALALAEAKLWELEGYQLYKQTILGETE